MQARKFDQEKRLRKSARPLRSEARRNRVSIRAQARISSKERERGRKKAIAQAKPIERPQAFARDSLGDIQRERSRPTAFEQRTLETRVSVAQREVETLGERPTGAPPIQETTRERLAQPTPREKKKKAFFGLGTIEEQIKSQEERESAFFEQEGLQRIDVLGSLLTGGGGRPIEQRSIPGAAAQTVVTGIAGAPIALTGQGLSILEKGFIAGRVGTEFRTEGLQSIGQEFLRSGKILEKTDFSFLPGGTPVTREGKIFLASAGLLSLLGAPRAARKAGIDIAVRETKIPLRRRVEIQDPITREFRTIPIEESPVTVPLEPTVSAKVFGVEAGTKSVPFITKVRTPTGGTEILFGKQLPTLQFEPAQLAKPIAPGVSSLELGLQTRLLDLTPQELTRIRTTVKASKRSLREKGLRVKDPFFNVEGIPKNQRAAFTKIVVEETAKQEGVFFGSTVEQQLPGPFRSAKVGDVDIIFNKGGVAVEGVTERIVSRAKQEGIDIEVSPFNKRTIQTPTGEKVLEAKSLKEPLPSELEEIAGAGFGGVLFPDIRAGATPESVVFGEGRAIRIGEQAARKGAASTFINPPLEAEALPKAFQEGGVFGKVRPTEPRSVKDVAGFLQTQAGIAELQQTSIFPGRRIKGQQTLGDVQTIVETFSKEQQNVLTSFLKERTAGSFPLDVVGLGETSLLVPLPADIATTIFGGRAAKAASPLTTFIGERPSPGLSSIIRTGPDAVSPIPSGVPRPPSPSPRPVLSPSLSPIISPVTSPVISPRPSPRPSPRRSVSPRPSLAPSPSIFPSPSPTLSPALSPIPSPAPSPQPSPRRSVSPRPSPSPFPRPQQILQPPRTRKAALLPLPSVERGSARFRVVVGRQGNKFFEELGVGGISLVRRARRFVETTPAATVRVFAVGGEDIDDVAKEFGKAFRLGKERGTFIQRRERRISSPGEVRGISLLGVAASRRKRSSGKGRRRKKSRSTVFNSKTLFGKARKEQKKGKSLRDIRELLF